MIISTGHDGHGERKGALGGRNSHTSSGNDQMSFCHAVGATAVPLRCADVTCICSDVVLDRCTVVGVASGSFTTYGQCECCCERLAWASRLVDGSDGIGAVYCVNCGAVRVNPFPAPGIWPRAADPSVQRARPTGLAADRARRRGGHWVEYDLSQPVEGRARRGS